MRISIPALDVVDNWSSINFLTLSNGDDLGEGHGDGLGEGQGDAFGEDFGEGFGEDFGEGFGEDFGEGFGEDFGEGFGEAFGVPFGDGFGDFDFFLFFVFVLLESNCFARSSALISTSFSSGESGTSAQAVWLPSARLCVD